MAKIFGIGLCKTGTTSLAKALNTLGYTVVDYDVGLKYVDIYDAATDLPVADDFEALDFRYPDSKFIYTTRPLEPWLESCRHHWCIGYRKPQARADAAVVELHERMLGGYDYDPDLFTKAYARHEKRVLDYFVKRDDLLILDLCGNPRWDELCRFLGKPIPKTSFPHANTREQKEAYTKRRKLWRAVKPIVPKFIRPLLKPQLKP